MTERDDRLSARYRQLAREEPPSTLDDAILAAARRSVSARPRSSRWMGPVSIAAVLVLGIGVSLRMQLEKPGIETSPPTSAASEYPVPQAEPPARQPEVKEKPAEAATAAPAPVQKPPRADAAPPPQPKVLRKEQPESVAPAEERAKGNAAAESAPNPFTDAPVTMQAPVAVSPP